MSKQTTATPGPWIVGTITFDNHVCIQHTDNSPGAITGTLAKVAARPTWEEEGKANARLIAAAPDLLAALTLFYGSNNTKRDATELQEIARAAISKATGSPIVDAAERIEG